MMNDAEFSAEYDSIMAELDDIARTGRRDRRTLDRMRQINSRTRAQVEASDEYPAFPAGTRFEGGSTGGAYVGGGGVDPYAGERGGLRSAAMRCLDDSVRSDRLPAAGAETIERLMSVGPASSRGWAARWVTLTGSEDYRNAFAKLVIDPDRGHLLWSGPEQEAFRRVVELKTEQRALSQTDSAGGYLIPYELDPTVLLTSSGTANPLMQISRVVTTVSDVWHGISSAGTTSEWLSEASEAAEAPLTFAQPAIPNYKGSVFTPFSVELEGDAPALMTELARVLQDSANQLLSTAFTVGTGSGQPTGIITALIASSPTVVVNTGTSEVVKDTDVYGLQNKLPPRFSPRAQWMSHLATINLLRAQESTNGAIRWPELAANPPMLLGRPIHENSEMDSTTDTGAENYLLVYGDFSNFLISQRIGSSLEIIPHLFGANRRPTGQRGAWLWMRYGSDVLVDNAFRVLNCT
ncbi:phage major capsid protein [Mycobacterium sp. E796]|uniref:phage major capsid protein n=1 Tax=Mycobacterium sp. E796 TaxID=1834151 RepID=UPI0012EABB0D|nr:phage major capsid protein [Mycobacterium sp. E796]